MTRTLVALLLVLVLPAWAQDPAEGDSAGAEPDSAKPELPPFRPDPVAAGLATFRLDRSVDVDWTPFREADDPVLTPGLQTLADQLRLLPAFRTRELSQGPTVESFALRGAGSGRADLLLGSRSQLIPGTSGPHSHEIQLSEVSGLWTVRGGAAALYGSDAVSGAVIARESFPISDELQSRAFADEGVDGYQRAGFQFTRRVRDAGNVFLTTVSRRTDGFFAGTKQVDRHFAGRIAGRVGWGFEGEAGYRRYEGDGRFGGFDVNTIGSILSKRSDWSARLFRRTGEETGVLLEALWLRQRFENIDSVTVTRSVDAPLLRITTDLPPWMGWKWLARLEGTRWRVEREEDGTVDKFWRGAAAVRATLPVGPGAGFTGTLRLEGEQERRRAVQARTEGWWTLGHVRLFAVGSRNERFPDRGAEGTRNEVHESAEIGVKARFPGLELRAVGFATVIDNLRPEPTFEQIRERAPVTDAPIGNGKITGGTAGLRTERFGVPGIRFLGRFLFRTSVTRQEAEDRKTGVPLPRRPKTTWTGEGFVERRFFQSELLARVRGRLTHWRDRVDESGAPVVDLWLTDVVLEGEVGDAMFFYRFHDLPNRADEVEPGIRFPGFSRTWGVTWRFRG